MSKLKIGVSAAFMLLLLCVFGSGALAEGDFPAEGIDVGTIDSEGQENIHRTHGNFQNNTNSCANCHSTHNGDNAQLIKFQSGEYDMCLSCHDGTMGFYNVKVASGAGTFDNSHESSSMHNVRSNIDIGSAPGAYKNESTDELKCSSCHNPHGSVNDRLLKESVIGDTLYAGLEKGTKAITLSLTEDPEYAEINEMSTASGLKITKSIGPKVDADKINYSKFCSTCHDDYLASRSTGRPSNTDKESHEHLFTHGTNTAKTGRNCASCHYAHGTDVTLMMDTLGETVQDKVDAGWNVETAKEYMMDVSEGGSALKKYTNMAVCWSCHQSTHALDTQQPDSKYLINGTFKGKSGIR